MIITRNRIGFRPSWMGDEPVINHEVNDDATSSVALEVPAPKELVTLRNKIAQLAIHMSSEAFAKMKTDDKLDVISEFAELNDIERGYTATYRELIQTKQ